MTLPIFGKAHEARPADAEFVWFVYGSSLDRAAFAAWAKEHGYAPPDFRAARPARLEGFRLAFDVASRFWGGAVASIAAAPGQWVEGLAVPMPASARGLVDHKEGAISGLFEPMPVTLAVDGQPVPALAYRSVAARRLPAEAAPAPAYLDVLLRGAREVGLSAAWLARLEQLRGSGSEAPAPHA
jgi:hypothetical protein